jgi:hypothetical protein
LNPSTLQRFNASTPERLNTRALLPQGAEWLGTSVVALLVANLVPLAGVILLGWEVFPVVFVFWVENVIVGVFNVLKMITLPAPDGSSLVGRFLLAPFFCFHYGLFCLVHGLFVFALFGQGMMEPHGFPGLAMMVEAVSRLGLWWAVAGLAVSHGISFVANYLLGGERDRAALPQLMIQPYGRIVVLHLAILGGGFLIMSLGAPWYGLALLILLKIGLDLRAHLQERRRCASGTGPGVEADGHNAA